MMRIDGLMPPHLHKTQNKRLKKGGGSFDITATEEGPNAPQNPSSSPSLLFLDGIMSLQGQTEKTEPFPTERTIERGEALLDILDRLHQDLLGGALSLETLEAIQNKIRLTPRDGKDPKLNTLIGEIELRLAVELAKLNQEKIRNQQTD